MLLEESLCSPCNAFLLGESHTFRPTSVRVVIAEPDFCENQCALVHHDQVNFTHTAVKVPLQCFEHKKKKKSRGHSKKFQQPFPIHHPENAGCS